MARKKDKAKDDGRKHDAQAASAVATADSPGDAPATKAGITWISSTRSKA